MRHDGGTDGDGTWSHNRYGDEFAAVYDRWYPRDTVADACAAAVAEVARGGSVLELGAGTVERIARPRVTRCVVSCPNAV